MRVVQLELFPSGCSRKANALPIMSFLSKVLWQKHHSTYVGFLERIKREYDILALP
jgi:hypothetical protein